MCVVVLVLFVVVHTFLPQQEGVEGHVVDTEVEEPLSRNPALPAAAGVERHQFLRGREAEVQLKLQQRLPELLRVVLLGSLAAAHLFCDEALCRRDQWVELILPKKKTQRKTTKKKKSKLTP